LRRAGLSSDMSGGNGVPPLNMRGIDGDLQEGPGRSSGVWGTAGRSAGVVRHDDVSLRRRLTELDRSAGH